MAKELTLIVIILRLWESGGRIFVPDMSTASPTTMPKKKIDLLKRTVSDNNQSCTV